MKTNRSVQGNFISGVIAAVIYAIIATATGGSVGVVVVGALLIGALTFAISFLVSRAMVARKDRA